MTVATVQMPVSSKSIRMPPVSSVQRILLVVPPAYTFRGMRDINPLPPMGLGYLASMLVQSGGYEVKIFDCLLEGWTHEEPSDKKTVVRVGPSDEDIQDEIRTFKPDLVGLSCMFSRQHRIYPHVFSLIKEVSPNIITVGGGAHVTVCPEMVLGDPHCDFIILGEAEESFADFVGKLNNHCRGFETVDGLGWKKTNGEIVQNQKSNFTKELDVLPFPAYDIMGLKKYFGLQASHGLRHETAYSPVITSRGCPARCTFCSANKVWGWKYRSRSVENVIAELRLLKDTYDIKEIMFEDDNVTANRKFATSLFRRMVEEQFDFVWDTPNGVGIWTINEKLIDLMVESGCIRLNFPIESGVQRVLDEVIAKPLDLDLVKRLVRHCQKIGLSHGIFLVVGMPGETVEEIWGSLKYCADIGCYSPHISVATPYPGTKLFDECVDKGYFSREFSLDDLFMTSFMLKSPHWDEKRLRRVIFAGRVYLIYRNIIAEPGQAFRILARIMRKSARIPGYIKRILLGVS